MARLHPHLDQLTPALDRQDVSAVLALLAPDCRFQAGNAPVVVGREAIEQALAAFFPNVRAVQHTISDVFEAPERAVYRGIVTYTRPDGSSLTVPVCDVFALRPDGLVTAYCIYIDWSAL